MRDVKTVVEVIEDAIQLDKPKAMTDFDNVIEKYNEEVSNAKTKKEEDKIHEKYESIIEEAEKELEKWFEDKAQRDNQALEKEQKASEQELKDIEAKDEKIIKERLEKYNKEEREEEDTWKIEEKVVIKNAGRKKMQTFFKKPIEAIEKSKAE